jgi:hypothetical protein
VTATEKDAGLGGPALGPAEAPAASNGTGPAASSPAPASEAEGCADCDDALELGGKAAERALGLFGLVMGAAIFVMGLDLFTGGAISRLVGLGSGDGTPRP